MRVSHFITLFWLSDPDSDPDPKAEHNPDAPPLVEHCVHMAPANSWQVRLDENGKLLWESDAGVVTRQPAQSWWQRMQAWFFKIAPEGQL